MPRHCKICTHPARDEIDALLLEGESTRTLAKRFERSHSAMYRHATLHLANRIRVALEARETSQSAKLIAQVRELQRKAQQLLHLAESDGDFRTALAGVRELARLIELVAKLTGELKPPQVNVLAVQQLDPATLKRMATTFLSRKEGEEP